MDLYPGQTFNGTVAEFWWANGNGQFLPSGTVPNFEISMAESARFAVRIKPDPNMSVRPPMGAEGSAIVLAGGGAFADLGRIGLRGYSWLNWVRPIPF